MLWTAVVFACSAFTPILLTKHPFQGEGKDPHQFPGFCFSGAGLPHSTGISGFKMGRNLKPGSQFQDFGQSWWGYWSGEWPVERLVATMGRGPVMNQRVIHPDRSKEAGRGVGERPRSDDILRIHWSQSSPIWSPSSPTYTNQPLQLYVPVPSLFPSLHWPCNLKHPD